MGEGGPKPGDKDMEINTGELADNDVGGAADEERGTGYDFDTLLPPLSDEERERRKEIHKQIVDAIKEVFGALEDPKFKKRGSTWHRANEDGQTIDVFCLVKNRFSFDYYLEAGKYDRSQNPENKTPTLADCGVSIRRFGGPKVLNFEEDEIAAEKRIDNAKKLLIGEVLPYFDEDKDDDHNEDEQALAEAAEFSGESDEGAIEGEDLSLEEKQSRAREISIDAFVSSEVPELRDQSDVGNAEFIVQLIDEFDKRGWTLPKSYLQVSPNNNENAIAHDKERYELIQSIAKRVREEFMPDFEQYGN